MPNFVWVLVIYEHRQVVKITQVIPLAIGENRRVRMRERTYSGRRKEWGKKSKRKAAIKIRWKRGTTELY